MQIVLNLHSILRWLIVLVAVVAIVKFAISWRRADKFSSFDQGLTFAFSGLMDFQVLLGLIYFFWSGLTTDVGFPSFRIQHLGVMLIAAVVAHLAGLWKKAEDTLRFRNTLFILMDTLIIILFGVARLPR